MTRCFTVFCVFGLLLAGCSQPPADTRDADARALRDGEAAWNKDWAAKDFERIAAHYAGDANLLLAGLPIFSGKEAIRGGLRQFLADPNLALSFEAAQVEVAKNGDLAYTRGTYTMTTTDAAEQEGRHRKGQVHHRVPQVGRWFLEGDSGHEQRRRASGSRSQISTGSTPGRQETAGRKVHDMLSNKPWTTRPIPIAGASSERLRA